MKERSYEIVTKEEFKFNRVIEGLDLSKPITEQKEVILTYRDFNEDKNVPAKHGIITLFKIDNQYYVLGIPTNNPETNTLELQASIGGTKEIESSCSIEESLDKEIKEWTNNNFSLADFEASPFYVCHREPDWGDWSVCFLKIAALSTKFTLEQLKQSVILMDKNYGIYELNEIVAAAKQTAGLPESADKPKYRLTNYHKGCEEEWVIFDDNAIARLFRTMLPEEMFFNDSPIEKIAIIVAMQQEANLIISELGMNPNPVDSKHEELAEEFAVKLGFSPQLRLRAYCCIIGGKTIYLIQNGRDDLNNSNRVSTQPAAVTALAVIEKLAPDTIINAGTAGGMRHAKIAEVYVSNSRFVYHDRRIPFSNSSKGYYDNYGQGFFRYLDITLAAKQLGLKPGLVSSGSSLDALKTDRLLLEEHQSDVIDMEAAAIAEIAQRFGVRMVAVKAVTNYISRNLHVDFEKEFPIVVKNLANKMAELIPFLLGKKPSELHCDDFKVSNQPGHTNDVVSAFKKMRNNYSLFKENYRNSQERNDSETAAFLDNVKKECGELLSKDLSFFPYTQKKIEKKLHKLNHPDESFVNKM